LAESTPVEAEPLTALVPLHAPEAEHVVALAADQDRVELVPLATELGAALKVTVGADFVTEIVADCVALPPGPVQVNEYVELVVTAPLDCEPLMPFVPLQPPEAEHAVALVLDQVSVEEIPEFTLLGDAVRVTVGAAPETVTVVDCVADPPAPVHVNSYSVDLVSVPVGQVPLVATAPCQPPDAVHAVASAALQVRVELPPLGTVVGEAASVTVAGAGAVTSTLTV
jgi:hypothetical protein